MAQKQLPINFIFRIDALFPTDPSLGSQRPGDPWRPPDIWNQYRCSPGNFYRWNNGVVTLVPPAQVAWLNQGQQFHTDYTCDYLYRTATIFYQYDAQRFLAVEFDAQRDNVRSHPPGWHPIGFHYDPQPLVQNSTYSHIHVVGDRPCLLAPGNPAWNHQLFPDTYHYDVHHGPNPPLNSAGVTGQLPLLLALAAFSCPQAYLHATLVNNLRRNTWRAHPPGQTHGR